MRKRNKGILLWLSEKEMEKVKRQSEKSGLSVQEFLRKLLNGSKVCEAPPVDFISLIQSTRQVESNSEKLLIGMNSTQTVEVQKLREYLEEWRNLQDVMWDAYRPIK